MISIHAPLTGCDCNTTNLTYCTCLFQSTHPLRDATRSGATDEKCKQNSNPRTPYGMRRATPSIYTLCRGYFNPRTPYGMRPWSIPSGSMISLFQSTHPLRDATLYIPLPVADSTNFNPRTPYGMRPLGLVKQNANKYISIHAPLTGCDFGSISSTMCFFQFQSTHPLRDATMWHLSDT